jgi:hypothetical protein
MKAHLGAHRKVPVEVPQVADPLVHLGAQVRASAKAALNGTGTAPILSHHVVARVATYMSIGRRTAASASLSARIGNRCITQRGTSPAKSTINQAQTEQAIRRINCRVVRQAILRLNPQLIG